MSAIWDYVLRHFGSKRMVNMSVPLITAAGSFLRLFDLELKSLWVDEALIFQFANGDIEYVLSQNAQYNSYPPLRSNFA